MTESQKLLAEYVKNGSEEAFRELTGRYVGLVYSAALRMVYGSPHLAEDVTQIVFADLARKARSLSGEVMLGGWLHRHACYVASNLMRSERRRQARERQAVEMNNPTDHSAGNLAAMSPVLDDAINQLNSADRAAIVLRYFEQRDLRSVGEALGSSEEAARKRVARAVEQLGVILKRRGVTISATALGAALGADSLTAAPAGLAAAVSASALTGASAGGGAMTILKIMATAKLKMGVAAAAIVLGVGTSLVIQQRAQAKLSAIKESSAGRLEQIAGNVAPANQAETANTAAELARLRSEAEALRAKTNELAAAREENRNLWKSFVRAMPDSARPDQVESYARSGYAKDWMLAFVMYAQRNNDRFPTNFEQAGPIYRRNAANDPAKTGLADLLTNQFEIVYFGTANPGANGAGPNNVAIIREVQARQNDNGAWVKIYGFADGHSQAVGSPDGDFSKWDTQFGIAPASAK